MSYKVPTQTIRGGTVNSNRRVTVTRGLVYDFATDSHTEGVLIEVGTTSICVTEEQADIIVQIISAEFFRDNYEVEIEEAIRRHPAGKGLHDN